jgi:drug/metabolite transporter (DMT)-like permease
VSPLVLALVLGSAVVHATWNLWLKQLGPEVRSAPLMWTLTLLSALLYAPLAVWMLADGAWRPILHALPWVLGSGVIHVGYFLALLRGYRAADLSLVYPTARGTGPLLSALGATVLMRERVTPLSITGALLVSVGVLTLTLRPALSRAAHLRAGLGWGLVTGASIAVYTLWDGWAVKRVGLPPLPYYWGGEVVRVLLFTPAALGQREGVRRLWREGRARVIGIAALSPLSYILILLALRHGPVSRVAPAREISILIGAWLGARVLGEGERVRRLIAAGAFAAGVIALAWG